MRSESELQRALWQHLQWRGNHGAMFAFHIHNNPRSRKAGARLKAMGLVAGIPDMVYVISGGRTLWHELKTETGTISKDQKQIHKQLENFQHNLIVTHGLDEALSELRGRGIIF